MEKDASVIQTGNKDIDDLIANLCEQRNAALDSVAMLGAKLKSQESLAVDLKKQLEEALKGKEGNE